MALCLFTEAIRREIEEETIRHLSKVRKPVSPDPIQLAIYSPKVPNLTMVDMPGAQPLPMCLYWARSLFMVRPRVAVEMQQLSR